jgi:hypothetical protein
VFTDRDTRGAKNQALFRAVNERVKELNHSFTIVGDDWVCECANETCTERIRLSPTEYEALRAHGSRFAVAPADAHFYPEIERVVTQTDRYWVVEKVQVAKAVTEQLDPRS